MKKTENFDKIILLLTIISLIILILLIFDIKFCSIFNKSTSNKINETLNDISIGIICSSIFYFIVQWYPNNKKQTIALKSVSSYLYDLYYLYKDFTLLYNSEYSNISFDKKYGFNIFINGKNKMFKDKNEEINYAIINLMKIESVISNIRSNIYFEFLPIEIINILQENSVNELIYNLKSYLNNQDDSDDFLLKELYNQSLKYIELYELFFPKSS